MTHSFCQNSLVNPVHRELFYICGTDQEMERHQVETMLKLKVLEKVRARIQTVVFSLEAQVRSRQPLR